MRRSWHLTWKSREFVEAVLRYHFEPEKRVALFERKKACFVGVRQRLHGFVALFAGEGGELVLQVLELIAWYCAHNAVAVPQLCIIDGKNRVVGSSLRGAVAHVAGGRVDG